MSSAPTARRSSATSRRRDPPGVRAARPRARRELVRNPLHQIVRDNAVLLRGFARELGLTPSARSGVVGAAQGESDPFEQYLARTADGHHRAAR